MEKALQTQHCGLVLAWHNQLPQPTLRRLQLAAITGKTLGVVFMSKNSEHSPSSMRLKIENSESDGTETAYAEVSLLKVRGSYRQSAARIKLDGGAHPDANLTMPAAANNSSKAESPQRGPDHD